MDKKKYKYSIGQAIFTRQEGLGFITTVTTNSIKAHMLETDKEIDLPLDSQVVKAITSPDPSAAVPFELRSSSFLREELKKMANLKDVKEERKGKRLSLDADTIVDKIMEKARKGEKINLSDL